MAPKSKAEITYLDFLSKYRSGVYGAPGEAVQEGFEYFGSREFTSRFPEYKSMVKCMMLANGPGHLMKMIRIMGKFLRPMMRGRKECFTDLYPYLEELKERGEISRESSLKKSYPNKGIFREIKAYGWEKWGILIGFTELPEQLIFKGKAVLFKYALVCIQEMEEEKINRAPGIEAGEEVQRVYNSLGHGVNEIAMMLRRKYGIKCQSNHPLGGLVNTNPLGGKAGMGWQGQSGMLITPQFGQRHRIAPIFIEEKLFEFTDNDDHRWIEEYCKSCGKCRKNCPAGAIYEERIPTLRNIPGIGQTKTCIDREKCFPQFTKTLGCSICIKTCPFSKGRGAYDKLKKAFERMRK